jgi:hypothetical protein
MREIILTVLEEWKDSQPNMASDTCRQLLASDLHDALEKHFNKIIEEVVCGNEKD